MSKRQHVFALVFTGLSAWCSASSTAAYSGSADTTLKVVNTGTGKAIVGTTSGSTATAILGRSTGGAIGVRGESPAGVGISASSSSGNAMEAASVGGYGLWALSETSVGVGAEGSTHGVYATASSGYGVWGTGTTGLAGYSSASGGVGVSGTVITGDGVNTGLNGYAAGGDVSYGIYSTAASATQNWAGYFAGNVHVTGSLSWVSDARFKQNVRPMTAGLEKVMALRPKTYDMKVEEFKGRMALAEGGQYGLIAEEVEAVLPELVMPVSAPARLASADASQAGEPVDMISYKSVNYMALIPILVEAVQEQQKLIQAQQARIEALEALKAVR